MKNWKNIDCLAFKQQQWNRSALHLVTPARSLLRKTYASKSRLPSWASWWKKRRAGRSKRRRTITRRTRWWSGKRGSLCRTAATWWGGPCSSQTRCPTVCSSQSNTTKPRKRAGRTRRCSRRRPSPRGHCRATEFLPGSSCGAVGGTKGSCLWEARAVRRTFREYRLPGRPKVPAWSRWWWQTRTTSTRTTPCLTDLRILCCGTAEAMLLKFLNPVAW